MINIFYRNNLRVTQSHQLQSVGTDGNSSNKFLGKRGASFEFSHLNPIKVDFIESAVSEDEQLTDVKSWIENLM